jgi:hypothetical protein
MEKIVIEMLPPVREGFAFNVRLTRYSDDKVVEVVEQDRQYTTSYAIEDFKIAAADIAIFISQGTSADFSNLDDPVEADTFA